jgi:hypothetical protein
MPLMMVEDIWHEDPETGERFLSPDFGGVAVKAWRQVAHPRSGHAAGSIRLVEIQSASLAGKVNAAKCAAKRMDAERLPRWVPPQCAAQTGAKLVAADERDSAKRMIAQVVAEAKASGWVLEDEEVFDPLPIGGSAQVYYTDFSTLADGQDITVLDGWTDVNRTVGMLLRKVSSPALGVQIDGTTNGQFVCVKTPFSGGPDQRMMVRLYTSNIGGAAQTGLMVRCAQTPDIGSSGGYAQAYRYRSQNQLVVNAPGVQTVLATGGTGGVDQGPYLQVDAEGSSIRCILTAAGTQYVAGPVTDTTWTANRGYVYLYTARQSNAQAVYYYVDLWDINPVSGVPMPILMSGQVRSY